MPPIYTFKNLAFRIHLKPAPKTQSESNAILRALLDLGPISTFQIERGPSTSRVHDSKAAAKDEAVANLVFTKNTKAIDGIRNKLQNRKLSVSANANIPDANVIDPYNVRGLKHQKPALDPRVFECHVVPVEEQDDVGRDECQPVLESMKENQYRDTFAVDRSSVFAEILAKTDCPSGLIHGLLPKLAAEQHLQNDPPTEAKAQGYQTDGGGSGSISNRNISKRTGPRIQHQYAGAQKPRDANSSNLRTVAYTPISAESWEQADTEFSGNFHDKFADIGDVSLMQMYREAIAKTTSSVPAV